MQIQGKYGEAIIYNDTVEAEAISQIQAMLDQPMAENSHIRIMPDVHQGVVAPIGFTSTLTDKVVPAIVGVDIGCGVLTLCVGDKFPSLEELDNYVRTDIPAGFSINVKAVESELIEAIRADITAVCERTGQEKEYVFRSIGSLGGGNHFLEVGMADGKYYLSVHTGSRNFGLKIANFYQEIAKSKADASIAKGLEYLSGEGAQAYFKDMEVAQRFADASRRIILGKIVKHFGLQVEKEIHSVHNYIDFKAQVIRKGAISSQEGEAVVIPLNMRDGVILGTGKGNEDWNYSAPHGAGRLMSRGKARRELSLEDFKKSMEGIYSSCLCAETLDESPMVYKDASNIIKYIEPSVTIDALVKPIWNFKGIN